MGKSLANLIFAFLLIQAAFAIQTTTFRLKVVDQNSAPIPNATVRLISNGASSIKSFQNSDAETIFPDILPGTYILEVRATGFKTFSEEVEIKAGMNDRTVRLEIAGISENVEVKQAAQEVAVQSAFSNFLTADQIAALPDDPEELKKALQQLAGGDDAIIKVDGFTPGTSLPLKSQISSIRIVRSSFDAENHELGVPYVIITTKPTAIRFSGSLLFNFNDDVLNARNSFATVRPREQTKNTILYLLVPVVKNKTSLSLLLFDTRKSNDRLINAILPSGAFNGFAEGSDNSTSLSTSLNQNLSKSHNARFEYIFSTSRYNNRGVGGFNLAERGYDSDRSGQRFRVSESGYLGSGFLNEVRLEFNNDTSHISPRSQAPSINVIGSFNGGGAQNQQYGSTRGLMIADNLYFGRGDHALKIGGLLEFKALRNVFNTNSNGTYIFSTLQDYRLNRPSIFTRNPFQRKVDVSQLQFGAYLQDDIRLRKGLGLSLGLRYENQNNIKGIGRLSPRIGFSWSPLESGKVTFRGGAGVYYDWLSATDLAVIRSYGFSQPSAIIMIDPAFPQALRTGSATLLPKSYWRIDDQLRLPMIFNASFGSEISLTKHLIIRVKYIFEKGTNIFRSRDLNAPISGVRPDPNYGNIVNIESSAFFVHHALSLGMTGSFGRKINFDINYQWSKSNSDSSGIFGLPVDNYDLRNERGTAENERPHEVTASLSYTIRKGLRVSGIYNLRSGLPYSITTGFDDNGDTNFNDRPNGLAPNTERGEMQTRTDLSLSYAFSFFDRAGNDSRGSAAISSSSEAGTGFDSTESGKRMLLKFYVTAENIFNQTNYTDYVGIQTSPLFGRPYLASEARTIRFGVKYNF